mmetsp:Transcript_81092/g.262653  ORF Transcript_81092/g.262653 Transcript_81092/m.262653 type:complete len:344 (+) Transcript_81092:2283-3314(+)
MSVGGGREVLLAVRRLDRRARAHRARERRGAVCRQSWFGCGGLVATIGGGLVCPCLGTPAWRPSAGEQRRQAAQRTRGRDVDAARCRGRSARLRAPGRPLHRQALARVWVGGRGGRPRRRRCHGRILWPAGSPTLGGGGRTGLRRRAREDRARTIGADTEVEPPAGQGEQARDRRLGQLRCLGRERRLAAAAAAVGGAGQDLQLAAGLRRSGWQEFVAAASHDQVPPGRHPRRRARPQRPRGARGPVGGGRQLARRRAGRRWPWRLSARGVWELEALRHALPLHILYRCHFSVCLPVPWSFAGRELCGRKGGVVQKSRAVIVRSLSAHVASRCAHIHAIGRQP